MKWTSPGALLARPLEEDPVSDERWLRDAALVRALRAREPTAVRALHERFARQVNRLVWRALGDAGDHDDLVQDVFLSIVEDLPRLRNPRALEAWVVKVTLHKVCSRIRGRIRLRARERKAALQQVGVHARDDHEARDLLRRCGEILAHLPEREARAFWLCHVDGRELGEAAELCGCSLSSMKRWLASAEDRFRRRIQSEPDLAERWAAARDGKP